MTNPTLEQFGGWNFIPHYIGKTFEAFCRDNNITDLRQIQREMLGYTTKHLMPIEQIRRLQRLSGIDVSKADFTQMDYRNYEFREGDVVYADPPYEGTTLYEGTLPFDHDAFWEWARTRDYPVYVSEYKAPEDFVSIWSKKRTTMTCQLDARVGTDAAKGMNDRVEHLFLHNRWMSA